MREGGAFAHLTAGQGEVFTRRQHGRHIAVDKDKHVFSNLFVSLAQRMGVEAGKFGFSTGVLDINQA